MRCNNRMGNNRYPTKLSAENMDVGSKGTGKLLRREPPFVEVVSLPELGRGNGEMKAQDAGALLVDKGGINLWYGALFRKCCTRD